VTIGRVGRGWRIPRITPPFEIVAPEAKGDASFSRPLGSRRVGIALQPRAPAPGATAQDVRVVEETIQQRGDGGGVAEEPPPVFHGAI
jgi:hypothetical protein